MKKYVVSCKDCKAKRQIGLVDSQSGGMIDWLDNNPNPQVVKIVSGRKRLDGEWGFQCICGNNDLETEQERLMIDNLSDPSPNDVASVMRKLEVQRPRFEMRTA